MNNENEEMAMKNASPRIVVSPENLPYFSVKTIAAARAQGIAVAKSGVEPNMIFWPGENGIKRLFLVEKGEDMLALRENGFPGIILAVTNSLMEMSDLSGVVKSIENAGSNDVWFCVPGKSMKEDPINGEFIGRLGKELAGKAKLTAARVESGKEASPSAMVRYRAENKKNGCKEMMEESKKNKDEKNENDVKFIIMMDRVRNFMNFGGIAAMILQIIIRNEIPWLIPSGWFWPMFFIWMSCSMIGIIIPYILGIKYHWAWKGPLPYLVYKKLIS